MELVLVYCTGIYCALLLYDTNIYDHRFSEGHECRFEFIPSGERNFASKVVKERVVEGNALQPQWIAH